MLTRAASSPTRLRRPPTPPTAAASSASWPTPVPPRSSACPVSSSVRVCRRTTTRNMHRDEHGVEHGHLRHRQLAEAVHVHDRAVERDDRRAGVDRLGGRHPVGLARVSDGGRGRGVADANEEQQPRTRRGSGRVAAAMPPAGRCPDAVVAIIGPPSGTAVAGGPVGVEEQLLEASVACWSATAPPRGQGARAPCSCPSGSTVQLTTWPVDGDVVHARDAGQVRRRRRTPLHGAGCGGGGAGPRAFRSRPSRPSRMIVTRSASRSTSLRMWLESSTVEPAAVCSATHSLKTCSINGSSPDVGSSRIKQLGVGGERGHQGDLLPVALGVRATLLGRVELETLEQLCASAVGPGSAPRIRSSRSIVSPPQRLGHSATSPGT